MTTTSDPIDHADSAAPAAQPARPALVRIPLAILAAFVVASALVTVWAYVIGPNVPDAIDQFVGVLLLFATAPVLTAVFLRGSRLWVRVAIGIASTWIWIFWLFIVLIPLTS